MHPFRIAHTDIAAMLMAKFIHTLEQQARREGNQIEQNLTCKCWAMRPRSSLPAVSMLFANRFNPCRQHNHGASRCVVALKHGCHTHHRKLLNPKLWNCLLNWQAWSVIASSFLSRSCLSLSSLTWAQYICMEKSYITRFCPKLIIGYTTRW